MRGMNSGRQTHAHFINMKAREKIFPPDVLDLSREDLNYNLGFRPAFRKTKQRWLLYDNVYINSDEYTGKYTKQTIFRGDIMFLVRLVPYPRFTLIEAR
jgi:hypothetical protein